MKTVAAVLAMLVFCRLGPAQTKDENQLSPTVRIYQPKNLSVGRARGVANFVRSVIGGNCTVDWSDIPHAIVISSENPADLDAAEALLKRFDVPEPKPTPSPATPQLDCTVYLIRASMSAAQSTDSGVPTSPVPAELQPAIDEMKHTFGYASYALWDAIFIQPTGGEGEMQGPLPTKYSNPDVYSLSYKGTNSDGKNLFLRDFQFSVRMPNGGKEAIESRIRTDVTIHEGQKLVLGKMHLLSGDGADLFLVLATKVH
jgi:hypothetical protein